MNILPLALAIIAGAAISAQAAINSQLAGGIGGVPIVAAFISFLIGTVILGSTAFVAGHFHGVFPSLAEQPLWRFSGGLLGAMAIASTVILAPRIGLATLLALVIAGQLISSLMIDNFAMLGMAHRPVTWVRVAGAAVMVAGVSLVLFGDRIAASLRTV